MVMVVALQYVTRASSLPRAIKAKHVRWNWITYVRAHTYCVRFALFARSLRRCFFFNSFKLISNGSTETEKTESSQARGRGLLKPFSSYSMEHSTRLRQRNSYRTKLAGLFVFACCKYESQMK